MDVLEAIKGRRSIRKYRPDPIPEEVLQTVLEAGRWAPSWANTQCWRFIVVKDSQTKARLAETLRGTRAGRSNPATDAVRTAPVVIAACAEKRLSGFYKDESGNSLPATDKEGYWFMFDVALAMQNICLMAHALGLGTVHTGLLDAKEAARILGLPDNMVLVELLPLGYPDESPAPRPRKELSEIVFYEHYAKTAAEKS